jgi:alpha-tubulin suppressor-like RCC1 family protein
VSKTALSVLVAAGMIAGVSGVAAAAVRVVPARTAAKPAVRGWGSNDDGELGNGTRGTGVDSPVKAKLPAGVTVTSVRVGCDHSVALTSAGTALAWGDNTEGQLGNGSTTSRSKPVRVKFPAGTKIKAIRAACDSSLALTRSGRVLAWGLNVDGQLGDGTTSSRHKPVAVKLPKGIKIKAISATCESGLALAASGKVYAWGEGGAGQLGDGSTGNKRTPVRVKLPAGAAVTSIAGGCTFALAQTRTGDLYAWGDNSYGQLGDGTTTSTDVPELISFLFRGRPPGNIVGLFAGCSDTIALFSKGAVMAWGANNFGQLGDGTTTGSDKPVGVILPTGAKIASISAGCDDGLARTTAGQVLAWGYNAEGQLGDGTEAETSVPVRVHLPSGAAATALGGGPGADHFLVITKSTS